MIRFCLLVLFFSVSSFAKTVENSWNGSEYAKNSSLQLSHAERLLSSLSLRGDEKILDVGSGDGKITALLSKKVPQGFVIGLDPSASMLAKAGEVLKESGALNLSFHEGFAEYFVLQERFDHIISIHAMHWVEKQEKALKNIYDHLNPKGHIHLILAPSKEGLPFSKALEKTVSCWREDFKNFENPQQVFDIETYRKLMIKAGFHIEAIYYVYDRSSHLNKETLKAWIKQWLPQAKHLSSAKQDFFLDQLMDNYLTEIEYPLEAVSSVPWGEYVLIVEGSKL